MIYGDAVLSQSGILHDIEKAILEWGLGIEIGERDEVNLNCAQSNGGICVYSFETTREDGHSATYLVEKIFDPKMKICERLHAHRWAEWEMPGPDSNLARCSMEPSFAEEKGLRQDSIKNLGHGDINEFAIGSMPTYFRADKIKALQDMISMARFMIDLSLIMTVASGYIPSIMLGY